MMMIDEHCLVIQVFELVISQAQEDSSKHHTKEVNKDKNM
jgi:hypothetical protein